MRADLIADRPRRARTVAAVAGWHGHAWRLPDRRPVTRSPTDPPQHVSLGWRLRHPQTTVRWRLTLLYGGMFLVCGVALLAVTYVLVSNHITGGVGTSSMAAGGQGRLPAAARN